MNKQEIREAFEESVCRNRENRTNKDCWSGFCTDGELLCKYYRKYLESFVEDVFEEIETGIIGLNNWIERCTNKGFEFPAKSWGKREELERLKSALENKLKGVKE